MKTKHFTFLLSLLCSATVFIACESDEDFKVAANDDISYYPTEMEKAQATAESFISGLSNTTRSVSPREVSDVYAWRNGQVLPHTRSSAQLPDTLLYIVNFKDDNGFVLVHALDSVGRVLAFIENGNLTPETVIDNNGFRYFLNNLQCYIPDPIEPLPDDTVPIIPGPYPNTPNNSGPGGDAMNYMWSIDSIITPLLSTQWYQRNPFNRYCYTASGEQARAGCVAIAAAQVVAYHQYPSAYNNHSYDWSEILPWPTTEPGRVSVGNLVHDIGLLCFMNYGVISSGTSMANLLYCWQQFGYNYEYAYYNYATCMQQFSSGKPVIIGGIDYLANEGHCWVVDGGLTRTFYRYGPSFGGQTNIIPVGQENLIHCNWGWKGLYDGYYLSDVFELDSKKLNNDLSVPNDSVPHNYNFGYNLLTFINLAPITQ